MESPDTLKMIFPPLSLSVRGMGFVCSKYKTGPCLFLFISEGDVGFSTEHPGCLFIYFPNIWTAVLWLPLIKAGSDAFCQQSTQRSGCSSNLCNSGTRWSPRKCRIPLHTECWIQLLKTQIFFKKQFTTYCGFPLPVVLHPPPVKWKQNYFHAAFFWRGNTFFIGIIVIKHLVNIPSSF